MIQKAITMTSKGTFTLPAKVRKELGLTKAGDKLLLTFHQKNGEVTLKKPADLRTIQQENARIAREKGIPPLTGQKLREVREQAWLERWERFVHQDD